MARHVGVVVLLYILAYVDSTPFFGPLTFNGPPPHHGPPIFHGPPPHHGPPIFHGPPPHHGPPPFYPMAPSPCGPYPMMPPPCVRFPFSCPPQNMPSPCQNRNNNNYRPPQVEPGFSMSINWGDPSPQEIPNHMKRQIRRPYNPYRRIRKNKRRRRKKFRGYPRQPNAGYPTPWQPYGRSYGTPYGLGQGRRHDEGEAMPESGENTDFDYSETSYPQDEPEDINFDGEDDDGDYDEPDDYDDGEGNDNGIRHDEGESYDNGQDFDDGADYDDGQDDDSDDY